MSGSERLAGFRARVGGVGAALSACLALWLGLFPAVQAAHLAYADHDHGFCAEHRRIEDVPLARSAGARAGLRTTSTATAAGAGLSGAPRRSPASNPSDLLLNFSLNREPPLSTAPRAALPRVDGPSTVAPASPQAVVARTPLFVAPKTSPPPIVRS